MIFQYKDLCFAMMPKSIKIAVTVLVNTSIVEMKMTQPRGTSYLQRADVGTRNMKCSSRAQKNCFGLVNKKLPPCWYISVTALEST